MAEAVVSSAVKSFGDLLLHEANFLYEVSDEVEELQKELKRMQSFLKDADARQAESESVRNWVAEIREIAYDAEDLIETFALKVASRRGRGIKSVLKRFALNKAIILHKVGSEIGSITRRISGIAMSLQAYGIKELRDREGASSSYEAQREKRQSFPHVVESNLVGLEQNTKELVTNLVAGEKRFRAISISGMGGLGKTTLAKQVYHHIQVRRHFDRFAWAYVSQQCQRRDVWQGILLDLTSKDDTERIIKLRDKELAEELHRCMTDNKCLVILDDIWSVEAWDRLKNAFPEDETGSKILLTSRNKEVASYADPGGFIQEPQCLRDEESWELLQKIAFSRRDAAEFRIDERMEEIGKQMVKHCAGLPLAIKVLGGLLATKHTSKQWQTIHENIKTCITRGNLRGQNHSVVSDVLSLSYDDLSPQLKQCFLYLGLFPEDYEISVDKLMKFWIAEGMVTSVQYKGEDESGMEDVAECYLDELIERSMVLVGRRDDASLKIETCRMHDLMRDLCLLKAEEESFLKVINPQLQDYRSDVFSSWPTGNFRRLAVHLTSSDLLCLKLRKSPHLRSLLFVRDKYENFYWGLSEPTFKNLKVLRVVDLQGVQIKGSKLPRDIGRLIHLRFLSLRHARVLELPSSLGNLRLLQTLDLFTLRDDVHVPNVIWKMERLRHLYLPFKCDNKTKLKLGTLKNLRTLMNFHLENCKVNDLFNMTNLRELMIRGSFSTSKGSLKEIIDASLSVALKRLQSLSLFLGGTDLLPTPADVSPLVSGLINLSIIELNTKIEKLPKFPPHITSIFLHNCNLDEDPMPILEKLPNLRFLRLFHAFLGREMVCSRQGFRKLHSLELSFLENLEEWNVDEGALPNICRLAISHCRNLKALPYGMITLQELEISLMPKTFKDKLDQGGEHFYKVQHVPSVMLDQCD